MGYTIRTDRFRYTEWQDDSDGSILATELYDEDADPNEDVNAASRPEHAEVVRELHEMLAHGWRHARPEG